MRYRLAMLHEITKHLLNTKGFNDKILSIDLKADDEEDYTNTITLLCVGEHTKEYIEELVYNFLGEHYSPQKYPCLFITREDVNYITNNKWNKSITISFDVRESGRL